MFTFAPVTQTSPSSSRISCSQIFSSPTHPMCPRSFFSQSSLGCCPSSPLTSPKPIPWFVSDVLPIDFLTTIESLLDPITFFSGSASSEDQAQKLINMVSRWKSYLDSGVFELVVPLQTHIGDNTSSANLVQFWTSPWPYWDMKIRDPELWKFLSASQLVIFKVNDRLSFFVVLR